MTKIDPSQAVNVVYDDEPSDESHTAEAHDILDDVVKNTEKRASVAGIVVGTFEYLDKSKVPFVDFSINPTGRPMPARTTIELTKKHKGRDVALMFEKNDVRKPIVIGLMHVPSQSVKVVADGVVQEVTAEKELILRCGKSSILLRKDGKIILKGENILSRARMTNKVKGGSVQIN